MGWSSLLVLGWPTFNCWVDLRSTKCAKCEPRNPHLANCSILRGPTGPFSFIFTFIQSLRFWQVCWQQFGQFSTDGWMWETPNAKWEPCWCWFWCFAPNFRTSSTILDSSLRMLQHQLLMPTCLLWAFRLEAWRCASIGGALCLPVHAYAFESDPLSIAHAMQKVQ